MRRLDSFIRKYGADAGKKLFHALQSEAAQARWKAYWRNRQQFRVR